MSSHTDARTTEAIRRRAKLASGLSYVTAGLTGIIVLAFIWQAGLFQLIMPAETTPPPVISRPEQVSAGASTIAGLDSQNLPYEFTAASALQDKETLHHIHLEKLKGTFRQPGNQNYRFSADRGLYDTKRESLDLAGNVEVDSEGRFDASMASAFITVRDKQLVSESPVEVTLVNGSTIVANGLKISDDGHHILFLNGVKAHFKPSRTKGDAQP